MENQEHSVIWEETWTGEVEPKWASEPSLDAIKAIVRQTLHIDEIKPVEISFLAQGAFNKLYTIKVNGAKPEHVMRVTLSVDPHLKVESEAATIMLLNQHTNLPVPSITAFDSSSQNALGYEWIIMKFMKGQVLDTMWTKMSWLEKEELVRRVAQSLAQLFKQSFNSIGNIYMENTAASPSVEPSVTGPTSNDQSYPTGYRLGEMVSTVLFWNNCPQQKLKRAPFKSSAEWLKGFAHSLAQLFKQSFNSISNIYMQNSAVSPSAELSVPDPISNDQSHPTGYRLGEMVSMPLCWNKRPQQKLKRGPFKSSAEWLKTLLQLMINENEEKIQKITSTKSGTQQSNVKVGSELNSDSKDQLESTIEQQPAIVCNHRADSHANNEDVEEEEAVIELAKKLLEAIPSFFPESFTDEGEPTCLHHDDLNWENILVDTEGQRGLTAILDWEFVSAVPIWKACELPAFLRGRPRDEEPQRDEYFWPDPALVASGEEREVYYEHLLEYQQTMLRPVFEEEMQKHVPPWLRLQQESSRKADFALAVSWCDGPFTHRMVRIWLEKTLAGQKEYQRLQDINVHEEKAKMACTTVVEATTTA